MGEQKTEKRKSNNGEMGVIVADLMCLWITVIYRGIGEKTDYQFWILMSFTVLGIADFFHLSLFSLSFFTLSHLLKVPILLNNFKIDNKFTKAVKKFGTVLEKIHCIFYYIFFIHSWFAHNPSALSYIVLPICYIVTVVILLLEYAPVISIRFQSEMINDFLFTFPQMFAAGVAFVLYVFMGKGGVYWKGMGICFILNDIFYSFFFIFKQASKAVVMISMLAITIVMVFVPTYYVNKHGF